MTIISNILNQIKHYTGSWNNLFWDMHDLLGLVGFFWEIEMDGRPLPVKDCTKFSVVPRSITFAGSHSARPPPSHPRCFMMTPFGTHADPCSCTLHPPPLVHRPRGCSAQGTLFANRCQLRSHKILLTSTKRWGWGRCLLAQGNGGGGAVHLSP